MNRTVTAKETERILIKGALILVAVAVAFVLVSDSIPKEWRFPVFSVMILFGLIAYGLYAMPRLAKNYEDALWGYLVISMFVVLFAGVFFSVFLWERGILQGESNVVLVILGFFYPLSLLAGATVYEILDHRRVNRTLTLHMKRLTGRMSLVMVFLVIFLAFVGLLSAISQTLNVTTPALVLSGLTTAIIFFALARKPKTRELLGKLEKGEW